MPLVEEGPHNKFGSAVFIRNDLRVINVSIWETKNIDFLTVKLHDVVIHLLYKLHVKPFVLPSLGSRQCGKVFCVKNEEWAGHHILIHVIM